MRCPAPQRDALRVALGYASGDPPDRFLVGLATLTLLAEVAEEQPLLCLVDDLQWLDEASRQVLGFVARRLLAEPVAIVFAVREPSDDRHVAGLPELRLEGLGHEDAQRAAGDGRARPARRARPRADHRREPRQPAGPARAAAGHERGRAGGRLRSSRPDHALGHRGRRSERRLDALPADTRRLLQLAAADPVGDPLLVWRAAERLGLDPQAATPAVDAGLFEIGAQVRFRHPCMRSAAYRVGVAERTPRSCTPRWPRPRTRSSTPTGAPGTAPRRRPRPTSRSPRNSNAQPTARWRAAGIAAAAAFLETAATLTPEPANRARRLLAAARAKRDAGALDAALELLVAVEAGPVDALQAAEIEELRGEIAFDQRRVGEAARLLVSAARRFDSLDAGLARTTHLKALGAAMWAGPGAAAGGGRRRRGPRRPARSRRGPVDLLVDALRDPGDGGLRRGRAGAPASAGRRARPGGRHRHRPLALAHRLRGPARSPRSSCGTPRPGTPSPTRQVQVARDMGALVLLQFGLQFLARSHLLGGDLAAAAQAIEEERAIAEATGTSPVAYTEMTLAAWRGQEALTAELIERQMARGERARDRPDHALRDLLGGGALQRDRPLRRRAAMRRGGPSSTTSSATRRSSCPSWPRRPRGPATRRCVEAALERMSERTPVDPSDWALGIEARVRALASEGDEAERPTANRSSA